MVNLDRTRALIAELASAVGVPQIAQDESGGFHPTIGDDSDIFSMAATICVF